MTSLNGNNPYLLMNSIDVRTKWKHIQLEATNSSVTVTAGSGRTHVQRAAGLNDTTISITLAYDSAGVSSYIATLQRGNIIPIEYGPESNVSGKPRHLQNFIIESISMEEDVEKNEMVFDISGSGADAPTYDMYSGAVYP